jgi:hypothetical protein
MDFPTRSRVLVWRGRWRILRYWLGHWRVELDPRLSGNSDQLVITEFNGTSEIAHAFGAEGSRLAVATVQDALRRYRAGRGSRLRVVPRCWSCRSLS